MSVARAHVARLFGIDGSRGRIDFAEPTAEAVDERMVYARETLLTALAERFQHNWEIGRNDSSRAIVYGWFAVRALNLLDLSEAGAVALGASHAISGYRKDVTRRWARALRLTWPDADGSLYASAMTGQRCATPPPTWDTHTRDQSTQRSAPS